MKILSLVLISTCVLGLSACAGSDSFDKSKNPMASINTVPEEYQYEVKQAKKASLSDEDYRVDGRYYFGGESVSFSEFPNGLSEYKIETSDGWNSNQGKLKIYQLPYSVVVGVSNNNDSNWGRDDYIKDNLGYLTLLSNIPREGKASYNGVAFSQSENGSLSYFIDFSARQGQGHISGLNKTGTITLNNGRLESGRIESTATTQKGSNGRYELHLFGPKAEEISGKVTGVNGGSIGFGGSRGEIFE